MFCRKFTEKSCLPSTPWRHGTSDIRRKAINVRVDLARAESSMKVVAERKLIAYTNAETRFCCIGMTLPGSEELPPISLLPMCKPNFQREERRRRKCSKMHPQTRARLLFDQPQGRQSRLPRRRTRCASSCRCHTRRPFKRDRYRR